MFSSSWAPLKKNLVQLRFVESKEKGLDDEGREEAIDQSIKLKPQLPSGGAGGMDPFSLTPDLNQETAECGC